MPTIATHAPTARVAPGPRALPWIGSTFEALREPYGFFERVWRAHGDVVRLRFGPFVYLVVNDPDAIHHVLVRNAANYPKSRTYRLFKPLLGDGLLTSEGDHWRRQRKLIQPAFHRQTLAGFAGIMAEEGETAVAAWSALCDGDRASAHVIDWSHASRCLRTCSAGSTPFQTSFPRPRNSRIERGSGGQTASERS
jgi:cytochrome P450